MRNRGVLAVAVAPGRPFDPVKEHLDLFGPDTTAETFTCRPATNTTLAGPRTHPGSPSVEPGRLHPVTQVIRKDKEVTRERNLLQPGPAFRVQPDRVKLLRLCRHDSGPRTSALPMKRLASTNLKELHEFLDRPSLAAAHGYPVRADDLNSRDSRRRFCL